MFTVGKNTHLIQVKPAQELRWLGKLLVPGVFDGDHHFKIEPISNESSRLEHSETFKGLLVPLFRKRLDRDTRRGFEEMNAALKLFVERK